MEIVGWINIAIEDDTINSVGNIAATVAPSKVPYE
jgi:hypothetical protein